ncbi:ribokinase [Neobacillus cucumis]|uniref:Ribokinase n=1 Tax=Neobacillus cucumis TaxID=1740721 RepID=A0A2N5HVT6_9BACI|nr:ribokinase [Neobacillus cucumis]PLS09627.1 ribokinase [Neobacillus cucumis]
MSKIIVIGSMNMDIVNHVENHPQPGETIKGWGTAYHPGGKGANQAVAAARSGGQVVMAGAVGTDSFAGKLVSTLQDEGIHTDFILKKEGTSGIAFITVDSSGENTIILSEGSNGKFMPDDLVRIFGMLESGDIILAQNEIPWQTTEYAIQTAHKKGVHVILNPAPAVKVPKQLFPLIDTLILNETEVEAITNTPVPDINQARMAAKQLNESGIKEVIITLGKNGSLYRNQEGLDIFTPSFSVNAVDTTSAGDTFIGAFAVESGLGHPIQECLQYATAAAALAVTLKGAQSSIPTREKILAFLKSMEK